MVLQDHKGQRDRLTESTDRLSHNEEGHHIAAPLWASNPQIMTAATHSIAALGVFLPS